VKLLVMYWDIRGIRAYSLAMEGRPSKMNHPPHAVRGSLRTKPQRCGAMPHNITAMQDRRQPLRQKLSIMEDARQPLRQKLSIMEDARRPLRQRRRIMYRRRQPMQPKRQAVQQGCPPMKQER